MIIQKVNIENYKCFKGRFSIDLNQGVNILVGNNETGKSTILEAINLALTGILNGRYLKNELSQYLFNYEVVTEYIDNVNSGGNPLLPQIVIEIFFTGGEFPLFEGNKNSEKTKKCGVVFKVEFDKNYQPEYEAYISQHGKLTTIPIEFYRIDWRACSRDPITAVRIPIKSALIDSSSTRYQNGSDAYISRIIRNDLEENEKVQLSQAYRKMKDSFMSDKSVKQINDKISTKSKITEKNVEISVDLSTQNSWETTLMTYVENVPFHQIGKGEQCIIKTNLALAHHKSKEANLILLEEPENHLSHTKLNTLLKSIIDSCDEKQVVVSTHSSFVANKLGLEHLLLLNKQKITMLNDLSSKTFDFFKKLSGYQTLRLILCRKAVLVEGDSDELIFQKAYMQKHDGRLPIQDNIDVISVNLTFERFLEIAEKLEHPVAVITDNDGDFDKKITKKYKGYENSSYVKIFADDRDGLKTLEPQFVDANKEDLKHLCNVLSIKNSKYDTSDKISKYMENNKTTWALKVFESDKVIQYPAYITNAVTWCDE